jgi:hypothetical protein
VVGDQALAPARQRAQLADAAIAARQLAQESPPQRVTRQPEKPWGWTLAKTRRGDHAPEDTSILFDTSEGRGPVRPDVRSDFLEDRLVGLVPVARPRPVRDHLVKPSSGGHRSIENLTDSAHLHRMRIGVSVARDELSIQGGARPAGGLAAQPVWGKEAGMGARGSAWLRSSPHAEGRGGRGDPRARHGSITPWRAGTGARR